MDAVTEPATGNPVFTAFMMMMSMNQSVLRMYDREHGTQFAGGGLARAIDAGEGADSAADVDRFINWVRSAWDGMDPNKRAEFDVKLGGVSSIVDQANSILDRMVREFEPEKIRTELKALCEFAERPENWAVSPYLSDAHMRVVGDYGVGHAIWTVKTDASSDSDWKEIEGSRLRMVLVSRLPPVALPPPPVVWTIAHMIGLRGAETDERGIVRDPACDWRYNISRDMNTVMVFEPLDPSEQH